MQKYVLEREDARLSVVSLALAALVAGQVGRAEAGGAPRAAALFLFDLGATRAAATSIL